ncbi:MAG: c-type cytochrome [Solirubrobacterales bacterium]
MKALLFVLIWVVAAFGVFGWAFRPKDKDAEPKARGPLGRMPGGARLLVAAAFAGAVIVTPILVTAAASDRLPSGVGTYTRDSSESLREGRVIFRETCASCHTLSAANARGVYGPSLDTLGLGAAEPDAAAARVEAAIKNGGASGKQMPRGLLAGSDARLVAQYIAAVAGK